MAFDARVFRQTLGLFATGVTVVSLTDPDGDGTGVYGMTANAFSSLSLEPPLVLVCVDKSADTHQKLLRQKRFAVNFLAEDQSDLSDFFARRPGAQATPRFHLPDTESPVLQDTLGWLDCTLETTHDGGDHTIFVGRVQKLHNAGGRPLLFFGGRYHRLPE